MPVVFFLSMCLVQCHFMNIALDHQMKALRNEKKNSELLVRKDGFKKVMEDICFLTKSEKKKIVKVTHILPGKKKKHNGKKRACKLNTSSFLSSHIFTNVLKLFTTIYSEKMV